MPARAVAATGALEQERTRGAESDRLEMDAAASVTGLVFVDGARIAALERVAVSARRMLDSHRFPHEADGCCCAECCLDCALSALAEVERG